MPMPLSTERLVVRPWREDDVAAYRTLATDVGYNCFSLPGQFLVRDDAEALERVRERIAEFRERGLGKFLAFTRDTGELVGTCGISRYVLDGREEVELGYRLRLAHWERGYASEAARAVLAYGFEELGLERILAFAVPQNRASLRIIEQLGFGYLRDFLHAGLPHRLYALSRDEAAGSPREPSGSHR